MPKTWIVATGVHAFVSWWLDELKRLLASTSITNLLSRTVRVEIIYQDGDIRVRTVRGRLIRDFGCCASDASDRLGELHLAATAGMSRTEAANCLILLRISSMYALRRMVVLPAAAEANLQQVLAWDIDRLTPFTQKGVFFASRVLDRHSATGSLRVELAVIPRLVVDQSISFLRSAGVKADVIEVAWSASEQQGYWSVETEPADAARRSRVDRSQRAAGRVLAAVAVLLLIATALAPFQVQQRRLQRLDAQLASARAGAEEAQQLHTTLEQLGRQASVLFDAQSGQPGALQVLHELTQVMPDDTWLEKLRWADGRVEAAGRSTAASALVELIEDSPIFAEARFRAPLTRDPHSETETFQIGFRVVPVDPP